MVCIYWVEKARGEQPVYGRRKYEGKDTACRALTGLIAEHLLLSVYLLDPAHRSEFSLKPYYQTLCPFLHLLFPCQEDYAATLHYLEKVTFSLFSFFSFCASGIFPVPTLHNQFSDRYPPIGLHSVVSTVLLGWLVNNEILFFSIFLESVFKCFFSCQFNSILFPGIPNSVESFLSWLKEESKGLEGTRWIQSSWHFKLAKRDCCTNVSGTRMPLSWPIIFPRCLTSGSREFTTSNYSGFFPIYMLSINMKIC